MNNDFRSSLITSILRHGFERKKGQQGWPFDYQMYISRLPKKGLAQILLRVHFEDRWYTDKEIRQIWAE